MFAILTSTFRNQRYNDQTFAEYREQEEGLKFRKFTIVFWYVLQFISFCNLLNKLGKSYKM